MRLLHNACVQHSGCASWTLTDDISWFTLTGNRCDYIIYTRKIIMWKFILIAVSSIIPVFIMAVHTMILGSHSVCKGSVMITWQKVMATFLYLQFYPDNWTIISREWEKKHDDIKHSSEFAVSIQKYSHWVSSTIVML